MKIAQRMHPLVDFVTVLGGLASALDAAFLGSSTIFSIVRSIFLASKARVDLQDYLIDLLAERISSSLPLIGKYREHFEHSPELLSAMLDIYGDILDIGNRAMHFFYDNKGKKRNGMFLFAAANWSSCRLDLERIQKRFDHHLDNFGRAALFAHAEETTSGLELVMASHRRQEVMLQQVEMGLSRQERTLEDKQT